MLDASIWKPSMEPLDDQWDSDEEANVGECELVEDNEGLRGGH